MSLRAIGRIVSLSASTVHRDVSASRGDLETDDDGNLLVPLTMGLDGKVRPSRRLDTRGRDALIVQMRADGDSVRAIAAAVGCSVGTVHRVIKAAR